MPTDPRQNRLAPSNQAEQNAAEAGRAAAQLATGAGTDPLSKMGYTPDQVQKIVATFNQLYGTNYDAKHPSASGFFQDPRLQNKQVLDLIVGSVTPFDFTYNAPVFSGSPQNRAAQERGDTPFKVTPQTAQPQGNPQAAAQANGRSVPYMRAIITAAAKYKVPWQVLWGLLDTESNFTWDAENVNADGSRDMGIAQINLKYNPGVTGAQAKDPVFAIEFAAKKLAEGFSTFRDWSLSALAYHRPASAVAIKNSPTGRSAKGWESHDRNYIGKVFGKLQGLGFDFADAQSELVGNIDGTDPTVQLPDPEGIKQSATDYFRRVLLREPTPQELTELVGMMNGIATESFQNAQSSVSNPFNVAGPGGGAEPGKFTNPLPGATRTSHFGDDRGDHQHAGVDLAAPSGTPVRAAMQGKVKFAGKRGGYGNLVIVEGSDGREYYYGHLSSLDVVEGDTVINGQGIGGVGSTGHSTGDHLHFEIRESGKAVDPEPFFSAESAGVPSIPVTGNGGTPAPQTQVQRDPQAAMREFTENRPDYKELYQNKPEGMSPEQYAATFAGQSQELLGDSLGNLEAIKAGLRTGQTAVTAGQIGTSAQAQENKSFRGRMFDAVALLNRLS